MKWYDYLFVIVVAVVSSAISYGFAYREINRPIYVVDISKIVEKSFPKSEIEKVYNGQVTPEEFIRKKQAQLDKIQKILESFDRPVFVKQAVFGGNTVDITEEVEKYLYR